MLDHFTRQRIPLIGRFADMGHLARLQRQCAGMALTQQMSYAIFNGAVGGNGFKAAKVAAVAAFTKGIDLNMADLADVAVAAKKDMAVSNNAGTGATV